MRKIIAIIFVIISGCSTSNRTKNKNDIVLDKNNPVLNKTVFISYNFNIVFPHHNDSMFFEDANIYTSFSITYQQISFSIKNKSQNPIKILWDESSMEVVNKSHKIIHNGIKYTDRENSMPPTTILPNHFLDDSALPVDNIYFSEGYGSDSGSWDAHELLLSSLEIPKDSSLLKDLNKQQLALYLPIETIDKQTLNYKFIFQVTVAKIQ